MTINFNQGCTNSAIEVINCWLSKIVSNPSGFHFHLIWQFCSTSLRLQDNLKFTIRVKTVKEKNRVKGQNKFTKTSIFQITTSNIWRISAQFQLKSALKIEVFKKWAPKMILFNEIFIRKIRVIFDLENWRWKSEIGIFWQLI